MQYEKDKYNKRQNLLYKELIYGLKAYTGEELALMEVYDRKDISRKYNKAQTILNHEKQKIIIKFTNNFFQEYFPNSKITSDLKEQNEIVKNHLCNLSFKEIGLHKDLIIEILIENELLPKDFFHL